MMTTMAALLGGLPLALGSGVGSELRRPLGITIVGGLILSQLLTLLHHAGDLFGFDWLAHRFSWHIGIRSKSRRPETEPELFFQFLPRLSFAGP